MKFPAVLFLLCLFIASGTNAQKLVLGGKTSPSELTIDETLAAGVLKCSDAKVRITSFSITLQLYGRLTEAASTSDLLTEEMREALELLQELGENPKEFTFEKVVAWKDDKRVEIAPLTVKLKS